MARGGESERVLPSARMRRVEAAPGVLVEQTSNYAGRQRHAISYNAARRVLASQQAQRRITRDRAQVTP